MFYIEIINNEITRYTKNKNAAEKFYEKFIESENEPVRGFDGKLYLEQKDIPDEIISLENKANIQEQIETLEAQITPRRMREAMLGNNESEEFLKTIESKIVKLRKKL